MAMASKESQPARFLLPKRPEAPKNAVDIVELRTQERAAMSFFVLCDTMNTNYHHL